MNQIVLGAARISKIGQKDANKLFDYAHRLGIKIIDTAASYGDSQDKISIWKKQSGLNSKMQITTKLGAEQLKSTQTLKEAIKQLQKLYYIEDIKTIFIHSLPITQINQKVIKELISIRDAGEISQIGYSGDGADLQHAIQSGMFNAVMCTLNPIDNRNLIVLKDSKTKQDVYAKRVMANYAWSLQNQIRVKVLRRDNWVVSEYSSRIDKYISPIPRNKIARQFINYSMTSNYVNYCVFGISSPHHLAKLFENVNNTFSLEKHDYPIVEDDPVT